MASFILLWFHFEFQKPALDKLERLPEWLEEPTSNLEHLFQS